MTDDLMKLQVVIHLNGVLPDTMYLDWLHDWGLTVDGMLTWLPKQAPTFTGTVTGKLPYTAVLNLLRNDGGPTAFFSVMLDGGDTNTTARRLATLALLAEALKLPYHDREPFALCWGRPAAKGMAVTDAQKAVLDMPIEEFLQHKVPMEFGHVRLANCLKADNIAQTIFAGVTPKVSAILYVGDVVCGWSEVTLLRIPNFGRKSLDMLKKELAQDGLNLGGENPVELAWQRPE